MGRFVVWGAGFDQNSCVVAGISGTRDTWELKEGVPRAADFDAGVTVRMRPGDPTACRLLDNVMNTERVVIVSEPLKTFLEARELPFVEYLPIGIVDHKGRVSERRYFLVHPVRPQRALDEDASGARRSNIDEEQIRTVDRLVIDEDAVEPGVRLFRLDAYFDPILLDRGLADEIEGAGFTGLRWIEPDEYPES